MKTEKKNGKPSPPEKFSREKDSSQSSPEEKEEDYRDEEEDLTYE